MINFNLIKNKVFKESRKVLLTEQSILLAEIVDGVLLKINEKNIHES